ncbi:hypothetical protein FB451DRAFT_1419610 [Mycena latifolia]|nr:hypothetical protein FB451DRAFT_1419610 [Mycena latifolia]
MTSLTATRDPETTLFIFSCSDHAWKPVCHLPLSELHQLSKRPAKWLSYVAWCVSGVPGRLHLSTEPTSLEILANAGASLDSDPTAPALPVECYFISDCASYSSLNHPSYVDLHIPANHPIARTESQLRQKRFRECVQQRDRRCVFSQASPIQQARTIRPEDCELAHIVPHSKHAAAQLRGLDADDPRNGLFLWSDLHRAADAGECIFLLASNPLGVVPNPYMDVADVHTGAANAQFPHGILGDYDAYDGEEAAPAPEHQGALDPGMTDDSRLLLQWVGASHNPIAAFFVPNNTHATLRRSTQLTTLGLHLAYATAIINWWGRDLAPRARTTTPVERSMDWVWDFVLQFRLPAPDVAAD